MPEDHQLSTIVLQVLKYLCLIILGWGEAASFLC